METTFIRLAGFALALTILLIVMRWRKMEMKSALALNTPKLKDILLYGSLFLLWIGLTEFVTYKLGLLETGQWKGFTTAHILLRGLSICVVAPIVEEIIFRGLLFTRINNRLGLKAALFIPAVVFALLHLKLGDGNGNENVFVIITFVDALYYGFVRYKTNSIYITMILHAFGNFIAMTERLW